VIKGREREKEKLKMGEGAEEGDWGEEDKTRTLDRVISVKKKLCSLCFVKGNLDLGVKVPEIEGGITKRGEEMGGEATTWS